MYLRSGKPLTADAAVIATGAWLSRLAGSQVRVPVQAGRGYSFTVPVDRPIPGPIYLPDVRVACTPYQGALRVSGTMEFRDPHEPAVPARVGAIVASASPLLDGVRWAERSDIWVGPRPVTPDGRALIGELSRGVYVAGGHGMWGLGARPGDRPAAGRIHHHRQATRSPARIRPAAPNRPLDLAIRRSTPPVNHARTGARVVRGGALLRPAPDDNPYLNGRTPPK